MSSSTSGFQVLATPTQASSDKKEYRVIQLDNGLRALLISDTTYPLSQLDEEEKIVIGEDEGDDDEDSELGSDEESGEEEEDSEEEDDSMDDEEDGEGSPSKKKKMAATSSGLKKSAAGLCVHMGSFSDPADLPGLAHFLEHMVFMGSEKYPDENGFDELIQKHGGFDNAHTDTETTAFYFETQRKHFKDDLDRFAQFFIAPLMNTNAMQREREAVDSEFEQALVSDDNRKEQLFGSLAKDGHPMGKFVWGNLESLQSSGQSDDEIQQRLHQFKNRHYFASSMTLAIQGQNELDTLQQWVVDSFSGVPNGNGQQRESFGHLERPFPMEKFHRLYKLVPVQNVYKVDLSWSLPPLIKEYKVKPLDYLAWIVGHEGKGSLISYLRRRAWALSLYAGNEGHGFEFNETHSTFSISIALTEEGYKQVRQVLDAAFSYLKMLQSSGPSERIFREIQKIQQLAFEFSPEPQPGENVETLCEYMPFYPPEHYLTGNDLFFEYKPEVIENCIKELSPDSVCVFLYAKELRNECKRSEKWFKTRYDDEPIPSEWEDSWKKVAVYPQLYLPEPNCFIAEDTSLKNVKPVDVYPVRIAYDGQGELFYRHDDKFKQPRAHVNFFLCSPVVAKTKHSAATMDLFANCMAQLMTESTYPADLAQLGFSFQVGERGLFLKVDGLNDKLHSLLETILDCVVQFEKNITQNTFKAVKDQTKRAYYNHFIKPLELCKSLRLGILQDVFWPSIEKHAIVSDISLDDVLDVYRQFASNIYLQGLVQGNMTSAEATALYRLVADKLKIRPLPDKTHIPATRVRDMGSAVAIADVGHEKVRRVQGLNRNNGNTVVTNYYQSEPGSILSHLILDVANTLMEEPVFDRLRTKEQLGYSVFSTLRNTYGIPGISITVCAQACKFSPSHVDSRIEAFISWFLDDKLANLTGQEFDEQLQMVIKSKKAADVTLSEEVNRNWCEITAREYVFDRMAREVQMLESGQVSLKTVRESLDKLFRATDKRKKLSVQVVGNGEVGKKRKSKGEEEKGEEKEEEEEEEDKLDDLDRVFELKVSEDVQDVEDQKFITDVKAYKDSLRLYPVTRVVQ